MLKAHRPQGIKKDKVTGGLFLAFFFDDIIIARLNGYYQYTVCILFVYCLYTVGYYTTTIDRTPCTYSLVT